MTPKIYTNFTRTDPAIQKISIVVVIPVGPMCELDNVVDTIESVRHHVTPSHVIILVDDSGKGSGEIVRSRISEVVVLTTPRVYGKHSGLYFTLSMGFEHAYRNYAFDILLRLDTDGLVIGSNPETDAVSYFFEHPEFGIIGSYRTDCNGDPREFVWPREKLAKEVGLRSALTLSPQRLLGWIFLRRVLNQSMKNGYEHGEHCMGGAYFMSKECVRRLLAMSLLSRRELAWSGLHEDQIFGLLIYYVGLKHGDFATGQHPMGLRWRGLPCSPEALIARGKKVIHSTRFFEDMEEQTIRAYFKTHRELDPSPLSH